MCHFTTVKLQVTIYFALRVFRFFILIMFSFLWHTESFISFLQKLVVQLVEKLSAFYGT
jgi:hypothetical protein